MIKDFLGILKVIIGLYLVLCGVIYFFQEKFIFFPQKLNKDHQFDFDGDFEELFLKSKDGHLLHGLLFKSENPKGLIFYLHGNAGNLASWGTVVKTYTDLSYDVFILDYRGYGKSEGKTTGQEQLFDDSQIAYNQLSKRYNEDKTIVLGYSIGTGLAAKLASTNNPKLLILQAPYYNLKSVMKQHVPFLPTFILKYTLVTNEYLKNCNMPVVLFHGDQDEVISYISSQKLEREFKPEDRLIILKDQGHNGMTENPEYKVALTKILLE